MTNKRRKVPKVQWIIVYHGVSFSSVTQDMKACWYLQRRAALEVLNNADDPENYEIVKYVRVK